MGRGREGRKVFPLLSSSFSKQRGGQGYGNYRWWLLKKGENNLLSFSV